MKFEAKHRKQKQTKKQTKENQNTATIRHSIMTECISEGMQKGFICEFMR